MGLRDHRYRHWEGRHEGIWRRRWVIAAGGLRGCLGNRWMRYVITLCWLSALAQVGILFCVGQLLVAESIVVEWAANLNPMLQTFVRGLTTWLEQHPEISVHVTQDLLFCWYASLLAPLSLLAVALAIPHLITRDLSSNAIVLYASKALRRHDYLLGKAGVVSGLLGLTWLGPVVVAWLLGNLLAPDWGFFWHGRGALGNALLAVLVNLVVLVCVGLGVSAVSAREKAVVGLYVVLWLVGNAFVPLGNQTKPWLRHLSLQYNLRQVVLGVFRPAQDLQTAQDNVPILGDVLRRMDQRGARRALQPQMAGTWIALASLGLLSVTIVWTRTKPE